MPVGHLYASLDLLPPSFCNSESRKIYILEINPLLVTLFANIFSHSLGCLFVLFMVSLAMQKLSSVIKSHLFIFAFVSIALGD